MVYEIDDLDMNPFLAYNGLKWKFEGVDGPDAGRDLAAEMHRNLVATKYRWDLTCRPLYSDELALILQRITKEWVKVRYSDPVTGRITVHTMYSNNGDCQFQHRYKDGKELWSGVTFPIIDK